MATLDVENIILRSARSRVVVLEDRWVWRSTSSGRRFRARCAIALWRREKAALGFVSERAGTFVRAARCATIPSSSSDCDRSR